MEQSEADLGQQYRVECVGFFCGNSEGDLLNKPSFLFDSSEKERERGEGKLEVSFASESSLGLPQTEAPGISSARLELVRAVTG